MDCLLKPKNEGGVKKSQSFVDVKAVDSVAPPLKRQKLEINSIASLLDGRKAIQEHENEIAEVVIVCEPEQGALMMGGLHPRGSLYERPINVDSAKSMHAEFRKVLRDHGVKVLTVREILAYNVESNMSARVDLENLAFSAMEYEIDDKFKFEDLAEGDRYYLSDEYKREVVEHMSCTQLIDTIMINPVVSLKPSYRDTGLTASYTFEPLSNLVYTRDQQITTCKGIVMGSLRSLQRAREVQVMKFCFTKLGLPVLGEIVSPGFLEGGDYFPMGTDLALLGIGLRSNMAAAEQLMQQDLIGSRRFGVVRDDFDQNQDRMHLDCVFSLLSHSCCIMLADIIGDASPKRRLVDEFVRGDDGVYRLARHSVEFSQFMKQEGYSIIPISHEDQLKYGCNILNLGDSRIIGVHAASARQIVCSAAFKGDVRVIDFSSITSMYGSVHCASQVVKRIPRRVVEAIAKDE